MRTSGAGKGRHHRSSPFEAWPAFFQNRHFLPWWLAQLATQIGGNMVLHGLTVLVFTEARRPPQRPDGCR
jgi:hypothetical protein